MTVIIQRGATNKFCITDLDNAAIYQRLDKTYKFTFTCDQTKTSQTISLVPIIIGDRYNFTLIEPADLDFTLLGFYTYRIYEVQNTTLLENLLKEGKMKMIETRTMPPRTTINNTYVAYGQ